MSDRPLREALQALPIEQPYEYHRADRKNKGRSPAPRGGNLALLRAQVCAWRRVRQPVCRMLGVGFVELWQRGSACRAQVALRDLQGHTSPGRAQGSKEIARGQLAYSNSI